MNMIYLESNVISSSKLKKFYYNLKRFINLICSFLLVTSLKQVTKRIKNFFTKLYNTIYEPTHDEEDYVTRSLIVEYVDYKIKLKKINESGSLFIFL